MTISSLITFDDVLIAPRFSFIHSRRDVSLESSLGSVKLSLPIFGSNMDTVTESAMCVSLKKAGGLGILHRFWSVEENIEEYKKCPPETGISIGLGMKEFERAEALIAAGATLICVDVAHAAQVGVVEQTRRLREKYSRNIHIMVGTFATLASIQEWTDHGGQADSLMIGIGPGSACTTRIKAGVGIPQLSALMECSRAGLPTIAVGGCRNPGDIAKALAAGAQAVMLGGMLAATDEAPGEIVTQPNGQKVKKYRGSASLESYEVQNKIATHRTPEGEAFWLPYKGPVEKVLHDIEGGLRSSFSYVGATNLKEFQSKAQFVRITSSGMRESHAHGKNLF